MPPPLPNESPFPRQRLRIPGGAFSNSYAALPDRFYARLDPIPVADPRLIKVNAPLAAELGLELGGLDAATLAAIFSGNFVPEGADPIATAYAGHQFGQFVPQLGDGRALLLGEVIDVSGAGRDIQLKGSGRTPFSRGGDGRAALGPVLREYLVSESMHALGIPTTRTLAAVTTGEAVLRETRLPGAILTRVAASHVRVGTFEYFAARRDHDSVRRLADHVIGRHYPELESAERRYLELLRAVCLRQATLVALWMQVGFIHGVMNTDNTSVSGETIDFGPCAFMDAYDPAAVFSSIDAAGRYAYANQPLAAQWNLARFAETLLPLIDADASRAVEAAGPVVEAFQAEFQARWLGCMRAKLGLAAGEEGDLDLVRRWLELMHRSECDFTLTFRRLSSAVDDPAAARELRGTFRQPHEFDEWQAAWRARIARAPSPPAQSMRLANPAYIPRNHRVEAVIAAAVERRDFAPFEEMLGVLSRPYDDQPGRDLHAAAPSPAERVLETFCGT
jgi:serine/tyrosine/threonine adenylyltransferase